jgi:hypothetical protein
VLSIEEQLTDGSISNPVSTIVAHDIARKPMYFALDAATKVAFLGDRFLHGYVSHQFAGKSGSHLSLCARARQFSRYLFYSSTFIFPYPINSLGCNISQTAFPIFYLQINRFCVDCL